MPAEITTTTIETTTTAQTVVKSVVDSVERVKKALETLKTKILEHENVSAARTRTNALVENARVQADAALASVRANVPASAADALARATSILEQVKAISAEKYTISLEQANKALVDAIETVATWKTYVYDFALQRVSDLDTTFQLSSKTVELASLASEQGKLLDSKYNIVENVTARAKAIDEQYQLAEKTLGAAKRAQEFGDSWTGARVTPMVEYVTTLAMQGYTTSVEGVKQITDVVVTNAEQQKTAVVVSVSTETKA
jgi:hypothetical protein